jgi:acetyl esterase
MGPLDPEMKAMLDRRNALGLPSFSAGTAADVRRTFAESQAALPPNRGAKVARMEDFSIPGPESLIPARRYVAGATAHGLILYLHGGGWTFGTLDAFDPVCRQLAHATGAEVVSVDYRLAPEHPFPRPLDDAWAALQAVAGTGPVAVMGDSAGGNLAAALAIRARDRGSPRIDLQILLYPVLSPDFERSSYREFGRGDYLISATDMHWFWDHYVPAADRSNPEAVPFAADLAGLPEAIVVLGGCDPLHDEGFAYAVALREAGVTVTLRDRPGMAHGFFTLIDLLTAANREATEVGRLIAQAFARA